MDLAAIARRAASAGGLTRDELLEKVRQLTDMADEIIEEVRRISSELRPAILDHVGLPAALTWSAQAFAARTQIACAVANQLPESTPLAKRLNLRSVWDFNRTNYAANHEYNLTVLRELLRLAQERGFQPVLYDQPLNTVVAGDWAGVLPKYRAEVRRIAADYGVPYLHVERTLALRDVDFADLYHLMPPARARWQARLAREVAALLRSGAVPSPSPAPSPAPSASP
jgi:hypothetical protein